MDTIKFDEKQQEKIIQAIEDGYVKMKELGFHPIPRNVFDWKKFICDKLFPSNCSSCAHNSVCALKNTGKYHCNHYIEVERTIKSMLWQLPSDWKKQTYYEDHAVIRGAVCSSCGYVHPDAHIHDKRVQTVRADDVVNTLFNFCPVCGRESGGYIGS